MPKKRHISLKDLAKELGVSVSTVSRALNDSYEIGLPHNVAPAHIAHTKK